MQSILFSAYGPPEGLRVGEAPKPAPKDDEVLIQVHAASVNSWDWELARGTPFANRLGFGLLRPKVKTLGADVAGRVEAVGDAVTRLRVGDGVFGDLSACGWGAFAEYVCAPEQALTPTPEGLSFEDAAAVPQAGAMALQGLRDVGGIQAGNRVLINGAGGGVGTFAVQIAKAFGAEVTGVDSAPKLERMRAIGADHVLDYHQVDYTRTGERYDLILDTMAHRSIADYRRALSPTGVLVMVGGSLGPIFQVLLLGPLVSRRTGRRLALLLAKANKNLNELKGMLEAGRIAPVIGQRYPLDGVPEAIRTLGEGRAIGKLVITVDHAGS